MKTAGYALILIGLIIVTFGVRGRTFRTLPSDLADITIGAFTGDTERVRKALGEEVPEPDTNKPFADAEAKITADAGSVDWQAAGDSLSSFVGAGKKTPADLVQLGKELRAQGFICSENKALGDNPRPGVHMADGYHYKFDNSGAIDVNWPNASQEPAKMDALAPILRKKGFHVLWRVKGHYNHLHVDISKRDI